LLAEFDLDAHVGLIRKLLKEDPMLVEQQSKLSGELFIIIIIIIIIIIVIPFLFINDILIFLSL
jgi:hypothetical protein